jgi:phenylalanyl-tRNA synthetase alpha chain
MFNSYFFTYGILDRLKMRKESEEIKRKFLEDLRSAKDPRALEEIRIKYIGRKGLITALYKQLGQLKPEERPEAGKIINALRSEFDERLNAAKAGFGEESQKEWIDLTLPGRKALVGRKHPLTLVLDEIKSIFFGLGFSVADGPEVETDYYNFEALNIPKLHPSRNMQDTLYISEDIVLRTHTSPVQIRVMERTQPPVRIIAPGRVYRRDTPDASHSPFFHQVEGLCVDKGISFGDLKAVISTCAHQLFGKDIKVRFRPSFFPFTEPSMEYDFNCIICRGKGCKVCKQTGWVEISGAGMVDPNVFQAVGYDPEIYTGYAFGMGVDRITMMKYHIDDIRLFFENDMRFLSQF